MAISPTMPRKAKMTRSLAIKEIVRDNSAYTFLQWRCQAQVSGEDKCQRLGAYEVKGNGGRAILCPRHYGQFCRKGKIVAYV